MSEDEEYCDECGKHKDDCECEEEESTTLEDINNLLDTATKGLNFLDKLKKQTQPDPNEFKIDPSKIIPDNVMATLGVAHATEQHQKREQVKLDEQKKERRHKETIKWAKVSIGVGAIVVILGVTAIIFG